MQQTCEVCYQIKCKECGWIPTDLQVKQIQKETLTKCPVCGWSPKGEL